MTRVTEQLQERGQVCSWLHLLPLHLPPLHLPLLYLTVPLLLPQVVLYLQKSRGIFSPRPDQSLDGFTVYGRFGSALAPLGDLDMDGYQGKPQAS